MTYVDAVVVRLSPRLRLRLRRGGGGGRRSRSRRLAESVGSMYADIVRLVDGILQIRILPVDIALAKLLLRRRDYIGE